MNKQEIFDQEQYTKSSKYGKKSKIPSWVKILLLKYWTAGSVLYFFGFGLSALWYKGDNLDSTFYLTLLLILGYTLINEYIVKPIVRLLKTSNDNTYYYNMVNLTKVRSLLLNFLYSFIVIIPVVIIMTLLAANGITLTITFEDGIDPFSFGLVVVAVDFCWLFIKNTIVNYLKKRKFKKDNNVVKDVEL